MIVLSNGIPCRLTIGPNGQVIAVAHDGNRVAFIALGEKQAKRLAQGASSSTEAGK